MRRSLPCLLLLCCLTPWPAAAATPSATPSAAALHHASQLMEASGLRLMVKSFSGFIGQSLSPMQPGLPPEAARRLAEKAAIAFAPGYLDQVVTEVLAGRLNDRDLTQLLAWHDTALGRRVTALEMDRTRSLLQADPPADVAPPSRARQKLLDRLMQAANAPDMMLDMHMQVMTATFRGMSAAAGNGGNPLDITPLLKELENQRPALRERIRQELANDLRVTYAPLSDAELQQYVRFHESPLGRRFNQAVQQAMQAGLREAGETFGQLLVDDR